MIPQKSSNSLKVWNYNIRALKAGFSRDKIGPLDIRFMGHWAKILFFAWNDIYKDFLQRSSNIEKPQNYSYNLTAS